MTKESSAMIKKTLTAAVAALTLAGTVAVTTTSAEAGWRGAAITAGVLGLATGAAIAANNGAYYGYDYGYRPVYYGGCGYVRQPAYNVYGDFIGWRRVPAC
jgi:hypothetical protein